VKADDVQVVADEENQKKTTSAVSEEKKVPEESGSHGWLVGGIVGGVLMTCGLGVLTSMVVKGKNDNFALAE